MKKYNKRITYNSPALKKRRQDLRNNCTVEENTLWQYLKNSKLGCKFVRQYSVGPYILDFFCPKIRLAIELDGLHHLQNQEYDLERYNYLTSHNIKIIRFWNSEIHTNINGSIETIKRSLANVTPS